MKPEDLTRIVTPSDPRLHAGRLVYVRSRIDVEADRNVSELWLHADGNERRLTTGCADRAPRWSPDGAFVAFVRLDDEGKAQVAVIRPDGGEAELISTFALGVEPLGQLEWSPDGTRLVVTALTWTADWDELDDEERARRPRRITRVPYRFDNRGWIHDRRRHLWLLDPAGVADPRCLTPGDFDEQNPAWSPDGSKIAFVSDRHPDQGLVPGNDVWEVDVATGQINRVNDERGFWSLVSYRPDGVLHLAGRSEPDWPFMLHWYRREPDGALTDLTGHLDRSVVSIAGGPGRACWEGDVLYSGLEDSGRMKLVAIHPDARVDLVVDGDQVVTGMDLDGDRLVYTATSPTNTGDVFEWTRNGDDRTLVALSADLPLVEADHFRVASARHEVDTWVYLPDGDEPVPVLLNIHGGPASQYGFGFFDEFQVYAGGGYGVVACNPRGSSGRGDEWVKAAVGDGWGSVDMADVSAALEGALARHPRLDANRLGIMGGSYGGFLTAWMIGHHDRFRSAVVERALLSWTSFAGTSDIAGDFPGAYVDTPYPDAWAEWWDASPMSVVDQIGTPTLIVHSENDYRCPIEQAEQLFTALLRNGTATEFLRFPGEGHEMSRSGKPRHRLERFEAILEWHGRWLG